MASITAAAWPALSEKNNRLEGRVAVVTGAARGIGSNIALRLAAEGAAVAVVDIGDGASIVEKIGAHGREAAAFVVDVTDGEQVRALAADVAARFGSADIVVNNAGIYPSFELDALTIADWRRMFAVNVESMVLTSQAFAPAMRQKQRGRIINMSSNSIAMQLPGGTAYIASKMAVIGLTRGLATELGAAGITVNAIAPALVRTPGNVPLVPHAGFEAAAQLQTIKRVGTPDDLTGAVAFLASDDSSFITGQTIYVDGGFTRWT